MIHVIALLTTKPGKRDAVMKEFRANVPNVKAERGCIEYGPAVDVDPGPSFQTRLGADTFMVIEKWASLEALKAHAAAPHMKAYADKVKDMPAVRVVHILSPS